MKRSMSSMRQVRRIGSEQGLTLMESLVAILMVSAVMVAITPPIFLTVATRVQNSRSEQASHLAHGEIDQIRVLIEQGITSENLNQLPATAQSNDATKVPPPTSIYKDLQSTNFTCSRYDDRPRQLSVEEVRKVDVNGDCNEDFLVQTFITNPQTVNRGGTPVPIVFKMGVRVYSVAAARNNQLSNLTVDSNGAVKAASLQLTTGEGQQTERPLSVLYTSLGQSDVPGALNQYRCFAKGESGECE